MTDPVVTPLPSNEYRRSPWKNGLGTSIDIADAFEDASRDWDSMIWRFGRTAIVESGPFSDLQGIDRMQVVVKGHGLVLKAAAEEFDERQPFRTIGFSGDLPVVSHLEAGPVEVVNLMGRRAKTDIALLVLTSATEAELPAGIHIAYAAVDHCSFSINARAYALPALDAFRIETSAPGRLTLVKGTLIIGSIFPKR